MAILIPASARRRAGLLVVAAGFSALLVGCGSGERVATTATKTDTNASMVDRALPPSVISDKVIGEQKQGSPARALLEWWQAFQFRDVRAVVRLTTPGTLDSIGRSRLERLVRKVGSNLAGIRVVSSRIFEDACSIRVEMLSFTPSKGDHEPPDKPTSSTPNTFVMKRSSGGRGWLFDDAGYLRELAKNAGL